MAITVTKRMILLICTIISLVFTSSAHETCSHYRFPGNEVFSSCTDLPYLQAYLHWNYSPVTRKLQIAYTAIQAPSGWIAWGINPRGRGMIGSQALVAFRNSNGSMMAYATPITSYNPTMLPGELLSFPVSNISAEYVNNEMIIFAVLGPLGAQTSFNHVWQAGSSVSNDNIPQVHPLYGQNIMSMGQLNLLSP
ncbi:hypothetical protein PTKIN_Ptkin15bG0160000 [Pterospermum kingtungense]